MDVAVACLPLEMDGKFLFAVWFNTPPARMAATLWFASAAVEAGDANRVGIKPDGIINFPAGEPRWRTCGSQTAGSPGVCFKHGKNLSAFVTMKMLPMATCKTTGAAFFALAFIA
jgi:hypothetical protein